jgi:hypothetical protein
MMITDFCLCAPRLDEAETLARKRMGKYVESNFDQRVPRRAFRYCEGL